MVLVPSDTERIVGWNPGDYPMSHPSGRSKGNTVICPPGKGEKARQTRTRAPADLNPSEKAKWRRNRASQRELSRIHGVAAATDQLRKVVPRSADEDKPSKVKLLRQAAEYIQLLGDLLESASNEDMSAVGLESLTGTEDESDSQIPCASPYSQRRNASPVDNLPGMSDEGNRADEDDDHRSERSTDSGGLLTKRPRISLIPIAAPAGLPMSTCPIPTSASASATGHQLTSTLQQLQIVPAAAAAASTASMARASPVVSDAGLVCSLQPPSNLQLGPVEFRDFRQRMLSPMQFSPALGRAYPQHHQAAQPITLAPGHPSPQTFHLPPGLQASSPFTIHGATTPTGAVAYPSATLHPSGPGYAHSATLYGMSPFPRFFTPTGAPAQTVQMAPHPGLWLR